MLIENQGRITTTGSISGFISGANGGVYSMSKFAMEAFTDSLAAELEPQGVEVSIVEPGSFKSGIMRTMAERSLKKAEAAGEEITAEQRRRAEGMIAAGESRPSRAGRGRSGRRGRAFFRDAETPLHGDAGRGAGESDAAARASPHRRTQS